MLILDDFLIRPISPDAASDTLEVIEDRHGLRSTILTSQLLSRELVHKHW
ncbi:ATP-binding protein [Ferrimicrobium sp.]